MRERHDICLRSATLDDADALASLACQLGYPTTRQAMARRLRVLLTHASHGVLVACTGARVVGWAAVEQRLTLESGERTELVGLVVDLHQRGTGVGTRLLDAVEQWAVARGASEVKLRSNVIRTQAHGFYEARGYRREKSQYMYVKAVRSEPP